VIIVVACLSVPPPFVRPTASAQLPPALAIERPFSVRIARPTASGDEQRALEAAEAAYPSREEVVKAIRQAHFKLKATPLDDPLWWSSEFDGVRIAFAITAGAVRYYINMSEAFRQNRFQEVGVIPMKSSRFNYSASVTRAETISAGGQDFRDVFVVTMSLSWSDYCGSECALNFEKSRQVLVSREGKVLFISGDGNPLVEVS
jgi:hypothetical protein